MLPRHGVVPRVFQGPPLCSRALINGRVNTLGCAVLAVPCFCVLGCASLCCSASNVLRSDCTASRALKQRLTCRPVGTAGWEHDARHLRAGKIGAEGSYWVATLHRNDAAQRRSA